MHQPLTFVCFKWEKPKKGFVLPSAITRYTADHVNILWRMLLRHYHKPFRLVCVTDDPRGIDCETVQIWDKCKALGGCFNRLYTFSPDMQEILGKRFVCIDLDCVITGDITDIFEKKADFVMNSYHPLPGKQSPDQHYNGALYMMTAGCRKEVWETFDSQTSVAKIQNSPNLCIGSDQAWIRLCLGKEESRFTNSDGVYEVRQFREKLPADAKIVFFAGARDPSQLMFPWVKEHWRG